MTAVGKEGATEDQNGPPPKGGVSEIGRETIVFCGNSI